MWWIENGISGTGESFVGSLEAAIKHAKDLLANAYAGCYYAIYDDKNRRVAQVRKLDESRNHVWIAKV